MIYLKKFNNDIERSNYIKSNFVSPHLFLDVETKNVNYLQHYKRLEYISSTQTGGQYIDLGCHLLENTDDIKIDIKFNIRDVGKSSSGSDPNLATLIGSQSESGSPWPGFILRRKSTSGFPLHLQTKWAFTNSVKIGSNKWESKYLSYYGNDQRTWQTIYEFSETLDNIPQSQVNDCTCTLFCAFDGNGNPFRYALADLYYLKFTKGGHIVRNLIPVQRNSDNEVGLWDMENQVFYTSQGNEPFVGTE